MSFKYNAVLICKCTQYIYESVFICEPNRCAKLNQLSSHILTAEFCHLIFNNYICKDKI